MSIFYRWDYWPESKRTASWKGVSGNTFDYNDFIPSCLRRMLWIAVSMTHLNSLDIYSGRKTCILEVSHHSRTCMHPHTIYSPCNPGFWLLAIFIFFSLCRTSGWPWLVLAPSILTLKRLVRYIILELPGHFVMFVPRDELTLFYTVGWCLERQWTWWPIFFLSFPSWVAELGGFWQLQIQWNMLYLFVPRDEWNHTALLVNTWKVNGTFVVVDLLCEMSESFLLWILDINYVMDEHSQSLFSGLNRKTIALHCEKPGIRAVMPAHQMLGIRPCIWCTEYYMACESMTTQPLCECFMNHRAPTPWGNIQQLSGNLGFVLGCLIAPFSPPDPGTGVWSKLGWAWVGLFGLWSTIIIEVTDFYGTCLTLIFYSNSK